METRTYRNRVGRDQALSPSERARRVPQLFSESIVHMIRHGGRSDELLYSRLVQELRMRVHTVVFKYCGSLPYDVFVDIESKVEIEVLQLLLPKELDPRGDFYEAGFWQCAETERGLKPATTCLACTGPFQNVQRIGELNSE